MSQPDIIISLAHLSVFIATEYSEILSLRVIQDEKSKFFSYFIINFKNRCFAKYQQIIGVSDSSIYISRNTLNSVISHSDLEISVSFTFPYWILRIWYS